MKKAIIIGIIIGLIISLGVLCITKHDFPTDEEWDRYHEQLKSSPPSEETLRGFSYYSPVQ